MQRSDSTTPRSRPEDVLESLPRRFSGPGHLAAVLLGFATILVQTMVLASLALTAPPR